MRIISENETDTLKQIKEVLDSFKTKDNGFCDTLQNIIGMFPEIFYLSKRYLTTPYITINPPNSK